jgi:hypothetical protein
LVSERGRRQNHLFYWPVKLLSMNNFQSISKSETSEKELMDSLDCGKIEWNL